MAVTEERKKELEEMADHLADLIIKAYILMRDGGATLDQAHYYLTHVVNRSYEIIKKENEEA